jgi:hypothetical protein
MFQGCLECPGKGAVILCQNLVPQVDVDVKLLPLPQPQLRARRHRQIQTPRQPPNYEVCSHVCDLSQDRA